MRTTLALSLLLCGLAFPATAEPVVTTTGVSEEAADNLKKGMTLIRRLCPGLDRSWQDLDSVVISVKSYDWHPIGEARGWSQVAQYDFQIAEGAQSKEVLDLALKGHAMSFFWGFGAQPGIYVEKDQARPLCNMPKDQAVKDLES